MSTQVKKQNLKNLEKKHKSGKKRYTTTTFSSFLQVLVYPFQLLSCYPLFLYFSFLVQALSEHKPYHLYLFGQSNAPNKFTLRHFHASFQLPSLSLQLVNICCNMHSLFLSVGPLLFLFLFFQMNLYIWCEDVNATISGFLISIVCCFRLNESM